MRTWATEDNGWRSFAAVQKPEDVAGRSTFQLEAYGRSAISRARFTATAI
jgi:hypothetical protein